MKTLVSQTARYLQGPPVAATGLVHRVRRPAGAGPHPTVVMLHGRAGDEDVMWIFARTVPANWLLLAPRGLQPDRGGGYAWHPRTPDEWPCLYEFEPAVHAVTRFIHALPGEYGADPEQIYLMGFSQGAATAFALAMTYPRLVRGIAGLVGFAPEACDAAVRIQAMAGLPIFVAIGRQDPVIPLTRSREAVATLRAAGAEVAEHVYDTGHKLDGTGMRDLTRWWQAR